MKTIKALSLAAAFLTASTSFAQSNKQTTINIKSEKFATPYIEKLIAEYTKSTGNNVKINVSEKENTETDIRLVVAEQPDSLIRDLNVTYIGEYALLPITSSNNSSIRAANKDKLSKKDLKEIFFEKDILSDDSNKKSSKLSNQLTVYSGNKKNSGAEAFASHFGYKTSDFKGKKISGDDIFLLNAIGKDSTGITFNNLSYIFDISSRQLKPNLALVPLDIKKEYREILDNANIDEVLALLENQDIDLIPTEKIGFVHEENETPPVKDFLRWVLSDGQKYNHDYGFLNLKKKALLSQIENLGEPLLSNNY